MKAKDVDLYLHQQGLDTSTPAGRMLFQMVGVFAEFERAMIVERVNAGLKRAKAQGKLADAPATAPASLSRDRGQGGMLRQAPQYDVHPVLKRAESLGSRD